MPSARNARTRRSHVVAAARISQRCMRTASPRRDGRGSVRFRRPSNGKHEGSRIVHPKIPDLAAAVRRLSAARRTRTHVSRSDHTPSPSHACAARHKGPSHADGEIALRCRPRTPPSPQLDAEAAPIQIIPCEGGTEWLRRGESAASLPDSDGRPMATRSVTNRQSDDPGPCRRCAAARSSGADAPTYVSLGSLARSGLRMRRSPRRAVPCGHRYGASLSATGPRQQPRSLAERQHPSRSSHETPDPIAHCGRPSKRERVGPTPTRHMRQRTHRFIGVKPDLAHALRSGCRHLSPFAPVGRARIARQAWAAHRWAIGIRVLRSTNVNGMCVGPC
jgi:hypothetical protein